MKTLRVPAAAAVLLLLLFHNAVPSSAYSDEDEGGSSSPLCPQSCSCVGTTVDCSGQGLRTIPRDIPAYATKL